MEMHPLFSEWYGTAYPNPSSDLLNRRWAVVEAIADSLTPSHIASLVALCVCDSNEELIIGLLNDKFKADDDSFSVRSNLIALKALGIGVLSNLLGDKDAECATFTGLAIHCGSFGKMKGDAPTVDIIEVANKYLTTESLDVRSRVSIDTKPRGPKEPEGADPGTQALNLVKVVQRNTESLLSKMSHDFEVLAEESNMYWWLASECSKALGKPFSNLPHPAGLLLAAGELANMTTFRPGPPSIGAILSRCAKLTRKKSNELTSIKQAINSIPQDWFNSTINPVALELDALTPIRFGVRKRIETMSKTAWLTPFSAKTNISVKDEVSDVDLALQYYQECLLETEFRDLSKEQN